MRLASVRDSVIVIVTLTVLISDCAFSWNANNLELKQAQEHRGRARREAISDQFTDDGRDASQDTSEDETLKAAIIPTRVSIKPTMTVTATRIGTTRYFTSGFTSPAPGDVIQVNSTRETSAPELEDEKAEMSNPTSVPPSSPTEEFTAATTSPPGQEKEEVDEELKDGKDSFFSPVDADQEEEQEEEEEAKEQENQVAEDEEGEDAEEDRNLVDSPEDQEGEREVDEEAELLSVLAGGRKNEKVAGSAFSEQIPGINATTAPAHEAEGLLNMHGGTGTNDMGPDYDKNSSNILDSITTAEENEIGETLPKAERLIATSVRRQNETDLEDDFGGAFNDNLEQNAATRRRLRGPFRKRVRKMRIRRPENGTNSMSTDTFFYSPNAYFTPNLNTDRPNSFNQGNFGDSPPEPPKPPSDAPRSRIAIRRFRSTTTALPPVTTTEQSPRVMIKDRPVLANRRPVIMLQSPKVSRDEEDESPDEDGPEPQIERPTFTYTEKSNNVDDENPQRPQPPVQMPKPATNVHNNETGEWLQSDPSRHHDHVHDETMVPFIEERDQWEKNYMNLQHHSFFSPSGDETPIITAEDVIAHSQAHGLDHPVSLERTLTKTVSMADGPEETGITQSQNSIDPSVHVVEHHHHHPPVTVNHAPSYDENSDALQKEYNDNSYRPGPTGLSSLPGPPADRPKYFGGGERFPGGFSDKIPSGSSFTAHVDGNDYFGHGDKPASSPFNAPMMSSPYGSRPYLSPPDQSQMSQSNAPEKKSRPKQQQHFLANPLTNNELLQDKGPFPDPSSPHSSMTSGTSSRFHPKPAASSNYAQSQKVIPRPPPPPPPPGMMSSSPMFSSQEFPNPEGSDTIPGPPPPGFRNPYMPNMGDHFNAMRNSIFKPSPFGSVPPPQSYSHFTKGAKPMEKPPKPSSYEMSQQQHHPPPSSGPSPSGSMASFITGITGSSPFSSLSSYIKESQSSLSGGGPPPKHYQPRPAPVWPGSKQQQQQSDPHQANRSPKKIPENERGGPYSPHMNLMDSSTNNFRTSGHFGGGGDYSPHDPSFYDHNSPNSPKLTLPMPGLVSIPTPPPDSHAMNQVTPNRHFPPHTHSMSSYSDYEPANPPLPSGHALSQHFDHFVQNAGEFPEDHHYHNHDDHHPHEAPSYSEIELSTKDKSKTRARYPGKLGSSTGFTGKFPEPDPSKQKFLKKKSKSKPKSSSSTTEPSSQDAMSYSFSTTGKNQYKTLQPESADSDMFTSPDYGNDASSSAMVEFDAAPPAGSDYGYSSSEYQEQYNRWRAKQQQGKQQQQQQQQQRNHKNRGRPDKTSNYDDGSSSTSSHLSGFKDEDDIQLYRPQVNPYEDPESSTGAAGDEESTADPLPKPLPLKTSKNKAKKEKDQEESTTEKGKTGNKQAGEAGPELDESVPSPFSETPYVLMFPRTLPQIRHHHHHHITHPPILPQPATALPPPSLLGRDLSPIAMSASEHYGSSPESLLGPGLKAVPIHPRHQMLKVLATKQYLTHLESIQERQRKPPPAIYTPYGVLVPMALGSNSHQHHQPFVPPKLSSIQGNAYSQLSPTYAAKHSRSGMDEKDLLALLLGQKNPQGTKLDKTIDLKESTSTVDPALDLLAEKLAIKLSSLEPFTPFRQSMSGPSSFSSSSSPYSLMYMAGATGASFSEHQPVKTPFLQNATGIYNSTAIETAMQFEPSGALKQGRPPAMAPLQSPPTMAPATTPSVGLPALKSLLKERLQEMLHETVAENAAVAALVTPNPLSFLYPNTPASRGFMKKHETDSKKTFVPENLFVPYKKSRSNSQSRTSKLMTSASSLVKSTVKQPAQQQQQQLQQQNQQQQPQQQPQIQKKQLRPNFNQPPGILSAIKRLFSFQPHQTSSMTSRLDTGIKNSNVSTYPALPPHPFASYIPLPPRKRVRIPPPPPAARVPAPSMTAEQITDSSSSNSRADRKSTKLVLTSGERKARVSMSENQLGSSSSSSSATAPDTSSSTSIDPQAYGFKSAADMERMLRFLLKLKKPQLQGGKQQKRRGQHNHNPLLSDNPQTTSQHSHTKQSDSASSLFHFLSSADAAFAGGDDEESTGPSQLSKRSSSSPRSSSSISTDSSSAASRTHFTVARPPKSFFSSLSSAGQTTPAVDTISSSSSSSARSLDTTFSSSFPAWRPIPDSIPLPSSTTTRTKSAVLQEDKPPQ